MSSEHPAGQARCCPFPGPAPSDFLSLLCAFLPMAVPPQPDPCWCQLSSFQSASLEWTFLSTFSPLAPAFLCCAMGSCYRTHHPCVIPNHPHRSFQEASFLVTSFASFCRFLLLLCPPPVSQTGTPSPCRSLS